MRNQSIAGRHGAKIHHRPERRRIASFGWQRDLPDARDHYFAVRSATLKKLPARVDLRSKCPPVYDQGRIGSCTANAIAGAIEFERRKAGERPAFTPSRLFIYYNERAIEGSVANDSGAQIRDGIKSVNRQGACPERIWPYDDTPAVSDGGPWPAGAKPAQKPPKPCYAAALDYQVVQYQRVMPILGQMKGALAEGNPFVFGFTVYASLYGANGAPRKLVPMPAPKDKVLGGHAVLAVGYDDKAQQFIVRNSWGRNNQDKGYFYMPYAYLTDSGLADDFWVIQLVER
jgi:C1A family cysteine protease